MKICWPYYYDGEGLEDSNSIIFVCSNDCSYFKISMLSHRMKTDTEMVCLRNFKRCRPPD